MLIEWIMVWTLDSATRKNSSRWVQDGVKLVLVLFSSHKIMMDASWGFKSGGKVSPITPQDLQGNKEVFCLPNLTLEHRPNFRLSFLHYFFFDPATFENHTEYFFWTFWELSDFLSIIEKTSCLKKMTKIEKKSNSKKNSKNIIGLDILETIWTIWMMWNKIVCMDYAFITLTCTSCNANNYQHLSQSGSCKAAPDTESTYLKGKAAPTCSLSSK